MEEQAKLWLTARDIIAKALREFAHCGDIAMLEHNAAAILARLAHNDPPILIAWDHEIKETP